MIHALAMTARQTPESIWPNSWNAFALNSRDIYSTLGRVSQCEKTEQFELFYARLDID